MKCRRYRIFLMAETPKTEKFKGKFKVDKNGFCDFGHVSEVELDMQDQYASRYINGAIAGYPKLGEGLRILGDPSNYHALKIHKDDIDEFVRRVKEFRKLHR